MTGFTLIEILVALTIISVGVLAIGSFSIATLKSGQTSRERLTAVHFAEQFLEEWQKTDKLPTLDKKNYCNPASPWTKSTVTSPTCPTSTTTSIASSCIPLFGSKLSYKIIAKESQVCGPPKTGGNIFTAFSGAPSPKTKFVEVNWSHKGNHKVVLTHVSKIP